MEYSRWRLVTCLLFVLSIPLRPQNPSSNPGSPSVADLSVEEILSLPVTSVGRKAQQVANSPAAVYVITQEEIRRSGAVTIPDVLRIVPGLVVARISGNTWGISSRGGTRQFANKMQVMIDGRPVYNRFFSGVFWDSQDLLLEDIDRIEVIRGPGAVMWGSNAVNGVIHIITKSAATTTGSLVSVASGNEDRSIIGYRYGAKIGEKIHYRLWGKQAYRSFYAPGSPLVRRNLIETPGAPRNISDGFDDDQWGNHLRTGFRLDWQKSPQDAIHASGMLYDNHFHIAAFKFGHAALANRIRLDEDSPGGNFLTRWTRTHASGAESTIQFWADRFRRSSDLYNIRLDAIDFEWQHRRPISENNEFYLSSGYRLTSDNLSSSGAFRFSPASRIDPLTHFTLRDEHHFLQRRLLLSVGLRAEHNVYTGLEWQPALKLLFAPNKSHSFWTGYSRAVRIPSRGEFDTASLSLSRTESSGIPVLVDLRGNNLMGAERLEEWAVGYRFQRRQKYSLDANAFHHHLSRLASIEFGSLAPIPNHPFALRQSVFTGNGRDGFYRGFELAASAALSPAWRLHGSWSYLSMATRALPRSTDPLTYATGEEPRHQLKLRSLWNLSPRWQFDLSAYAIDRIPAYQIQGYLRIDSRLGFKPSRTNDLSFIVQDWLDQRRLEFQSELFTYAVPVRRSILVRWTTQF